MRAIILAAGYGNRMRPITNSIHKTMLSINGHTIIERIVSGLIENEILDIIVVTGYRAKEVESYLSTRFPEVNFEFIENRRFKETNNIFSLALALDSVNIDDDIVFIESDLIYEPKVIERVVKTKYDNVALVCKYRSGMDGTVVSISGDVVTEVIPPHLQGDRFDFTDKYKTLNIYKFSKSFCRNEFKRLLTYYAKVIDDNCYYELILGILIYLGRDTLHCEIIEDEKWAEIDDPNDLRVAEYIFDGKKRRELLENGFGGYWTYDVLDFCFIRNMYFPGPSVLSEMRNNLNELVYNYGSSQYLLNQKLSYVVECAENRLITLHGASQIYPILREYFKGRKVLLPEPTFGEYPRIFPNNTVYSDKVGIMLKKMEDNVKDVEVVVIVNPNNPTGTVLPQEFIYYLLNKYPQKYFIVDESFIEFSDVPSVINSLEEKQLDNVIVIKSMSKTYGCPGLRLGYIYTCDNKLYNYIYENIPIWNLNSMAEYMLEVILKKKIEIHQSFIQTKKDREAFYRALSGIDYIKEAYRSHGNFILLRINGKEFNGSDIVELMLERYSTYIKDVSHKFNDGDLYFRFAVRLPYENELLIARFTECLNSLSNKR
ncbi:MAG: aminotransferase class I/II-fold pyridoxal phosphate-dependent enzyme [bacterium]